MYVINKINYMYIYYVKFISFILSCNEDFLSYCLIIKYFVCKKVIFNYFVV